MKIKLKILNLYYKIIGEFPKCTVFSADWINTRVSCKFFKKIKKHFIKSSYIIIDVGSGASPYYNFFQDIDKEYIAVDLQTALPKNEKRKIKQIVGSIECLPFSDNSADIILCAAVLEHVEDPFKAFKEIYRVLKPGGFFIGSIPFLYPIHMEPYDYWRFTDFGIKKILLKENFELLEFDRNFGVFSAITVIINRGLICPFKTNFEKINKCFKIIDNLYVREFLFFPIIGFLNIISFLLDKIFIFNRNNSATIFLWLSQKN
ncbi:MAG TPA: class I SAM-dependent methyltransferase [Candidatus Gastranaerophilales bacterium]|nr:class I SAM-dependent methyltransferase [Candidatus Gastranaerophilales bacterium]